MSSDFSTRPRIIVIGVGGAGCNAINNMIRANLEGVEFLVANTDAQAISQSLVEESNRIKLGPDITRGLGAGSKPDIGAAAAEESAKEILSKISGANMLFITAGMGGGTGTGAAPVIARIARESGILTIAVVSKPFFFEGAHRSKSAERGLVELQKNVDTLIIIPNQNLFKVANEQTTFADAFKMADEVLYSGVRGVTDLMIMPGLINLDFADVRSVMAEMGKAMMGTGEAEGERRALEAAEAAISNPLIDDVSMKGARGVLINITGGFDMTLYEVDEAANRIRDDVDEDANIIFGSTFDERLSGKIRVSVVATGIGTIHKKEVENENSAEKNAGINGLIRKTFSGASSFTQGQSRVYVADDLENSFEKSKSQFNNNQFLDEENRQNYNDTGYEENYNEEKNVNYQKNERRNEIHEEKKKKVSLFDRLTGGGKNKYDSQKNSTQISESKMRQNENDDDSIEIPAFLRRDKK